MGENDTNQLYQAETTARREAKGLRDGSKSVIVWRKQTGLPRVNNRLGFVRWWPAWYGNSESAVISGIFFFVLFFSLEKAGQVWDPPMISMGSVGRTFLRPWPTSRAHKRRTESPAGQFYL